MTISRWPPAPIPKIELIYKLQKPYPELPDPHAEFPDLEQLLEPVRGVFRTRPYLSLGSTETHIGHNRGAITTDGRFV